TVGYTTVTLDFWHFFKFQGALNEVAKIQVSTDGTTWEDVATYQTDQGNFIDFVHPSVNLSSYKDEANVRIRFFYYSDGRGRYWGIDNVNITGSSASNTDIKWTSAPAGFTSNVADPPVVNPTETTIYTVT